MAVTFVSSAFLLLTLTGAAIDAYKVVCYFTNWAQYRPDEGKFVPGDIDPKLCTHIVYAFAKLDGNRLAPYEWNDVKTSYSEGMYSKVIALKKDNPDLKVLLAVGGWNMGCVPFTKMAATEASRKEFCNSSVEFLTQHGFDGLDVDWEYPAQRGSPLADKRRFTLLIQECRKTFGNGLLLTAAVAPDAKSATLSYEVANITENLDYISIMAYDMRGVWNEETGHHAPLHSFLHEPPALQGVNIARSVDWWLINGAPANKIVLGLPAYARTFTLKQAAVPDIALPIHSAGSPGDYTREAGFLAYYEVCNKFKGGTRKHYKNQGNIVIAAKHNQWSGFDDEDTMTAKTTWIKEKNLAGAMLWALDLDDFTGEFCRRGKYPLLKSIARNLRNETDIPPNEPHKDTKTTAVPTPDTNQPTTPEIDLTEKHRPGGLCSDNGALVAFPGFCAKYLVCDNEEYVEMTCPADLHFNPDDGMCDAPENVTC